MHATTTSPVLAALIAAGVPSRLRSTAHVNAAISAALTVLAVTNRDWRGFPRDRDVSRAWWAAEVERAAAVQA